MDKIWADILPQQNSRNKKMKPGNCPKLNEMEVQLDPNNHKIFILIFLSDKTTRFRNKRMDDWEFHLKSVAIYAHQILKQSK